MGTTIRFSIYFRLHHHNPIPPDQTESGFDHDNSKDMDALMATPLWQAMPFVRAGRFQRVPAVWFYGATLSAMHFVRILDNAIGGKA